MMLKTRTAPGLMVHMVQGGEKENFRHREAVITAGCQDISEEKKPWGKSLNLARRQQLPGVWRASNHRGSREHKPDGRRTRSDWQVGQWRQQPSPPCQEGYQEEKREPREEAADLGRGFSGDSARLRADGKRLAGVTLVELLGGGAKGRGEFLSS